MRKETRCRHIGYSFRLAARVLLYAPSHKQDNTYHGLCYTSRGALAGMRFSSMGPPMKDRSDDPSHHERMLLPRSFDRECHIMAHLLYSMSSNSASKITFQCRPIVITFSHLFNRRTERSLIEGRSHITLVLA